MKTRDIITFLMAGLFTLSAVAATTSSEPKVVRFGLIPADDATEMLRNYEPVRQYLAKALGIPVELKVTMDYNAAIEAMRAKHIEVAWFGPFAYVLAADVAGAEAIVNGVRRDTGTSTYRTIFVAHRDSGIKSIKDLKGRSIAFVDPASTSGYLMPMYILRRQGYADRDFKATMYAGTHNAVQLSVKNRKVDVGADSDTSFGRMVKAGEIDPKVNVVIHESEPMPGSPIAIRGDLDPAFKKRVQKALLDMDEQTFYQVRGWGDIARYEPASDRDYDIVREMAKVLNVNLRKGK